MYINRKIHWRHKLLIVLSLLIFLSITGCSPNKQAHKTTLFALDTVIEITAYGEQAPRALEQASAEIKRLEALLDAHQKTSEISQLNQQAGLAPVKLSPETFAVLAQAQLYAQQSNGAFDPTIKPLVDLWAIGKGQETVPSAAAIRQSLSLVNFKRLQLDATTQTAFLLDKNMGVDLGGIAKNYILLQVRSLLAQQQVKHALINGGGDIYTLGQNPQGQPWTIGVQHPRNAQAIIAKVRLEPWDQVATSGDYQRYFLVGDQRYHHIFDLKTGYPTNSLSSATLFSKFPAPTFPSSLCLILGKSATLEFIAQHYPHVQALLVDSQQQVSHTAALNGQITIAKPN